MGFMAFVSKAAFKVKKASPTLFFIGGVAAVGAGTVLMVKATKKAENVIDNFNDEKDVYIKTTEDSEETQQKVVADMKKDATWKVVKTYAAPVGLEILGLASFGASFGILEKRNVIALGAAEAASSKLNLVKKRAKEMLEPDKARELLYGIVEDPDLPPFDIVDENGVRVTSPANKLDDEYTALSMIFDETSDQWREDPAECLSFLRGLETRTYVYLRKYGHIFENTIRHWAGLPDTSEGAIWGQIYDPTRGPEQVDLGVTRIYQNTPMIDFHKQHCFVLNPEGFEVIWRKI